MPTTSLAVVADELAQLGLLLVLAHREQAARQIAPAIGRAVLALLESLDLAVRDVVEHVLERAHRRRALASAILPRDDPALDLGEQALAVGVEPLEAIFGFPDRPVAGHEDPVTHRRNPEDRLP